MNKKSTALKLVLLILLLAGYVSLKAAIEKRPFSSFLLTSEQNESNLKEDSDSLSMALKKLNLSLKPFLEARLMDSSRKIVDQILKKITVRLVKENKTLGEAYYLVGVYYMFAYKYSEAIRFLTLAISVMEKNGEFDGRYAKALYNNGLAFYRLGDFNKHEFYSLKSLEVEKKTFGDSSPGLIKTINSLLIANIELQEYEKAINYSNIALNLAAKNVGVVPGADIADIYNNLGVCYTRLADFSKAKIYLEKAESTYRNNHLGLNTSYVNLMNSMAITYRSLGMTEKSNEYYEKGVKLAATVISAESNNIIFSYAIILGNTGQKQKGLALLENRLERERKNSGENSAAYYEVLKNLAEYLREYNIDKKKSLALFEKSIDYINKNPKNQLLSDVIKIGYALSLNETGDQKRAIRVIQSLLFDKGGQVISGENYDNPIISNLKSDKVSLRILKAKYRILSDMFRRSPDLNILKSASKTSELIVALIEKVRINIAEEESRLVLGENYRDAYLNAIRDLNLLFEITSDKNYLEKAFEYSEKSKVAGLLTSTRELKANQLVIPSGISELERKINRDINFYNVRIEDETKNDKPDTLLKNSLSERLLVSTRKRDSLVSVFEKQYPGYYAIKYNTNVLTIKDLPGIIGHNTNYINYIASDTTLYIFVANRKYQQLLEMRIDTFFYKRIRRFRELLSLPSPSVDAKLLYNDYLSVGYKLYKDLFEPVRKYLISDKILISPDNIISYLPFETLPSSDKPGTNLIFRDIDYLMKDFEFSYTYSATFMGESGKRNLSSGLWNSLISFAPDYNQSGDRTFGSGITGTGIYDLPDLPYAREEAKFVSEITGGNLFAGNNAKKTVFKREAGRYDIIHLAMHALLNDKEPLKSTLIFSHGDGSDDDPYLKTYEVYGIPLKAKMVVLSACNSGSGLLFSGEGIISLARGFIYSGSESVVMSMWDIEDRSGTEIVKTFYENLKKGNTKSGALRKARSECLKKADQLRSHPYFWSALVIYGNNAPLYYSHQLIRGLIVIISLIALIIIAYFLKRKYS